ncbi:hypothetical protein [Lacinutrix himadriensis]|uniref:hypothetical protein n=1 Tax=Lacinutrix himadriensis TaxID=641549 RepID=UPI0006E46D9A|nr:hypothetical protein [Lacinutrix himadriensis]
MVKPTLKLYLFNIINLLLVCFIIQLLFTIVFNSPNDNADFTGINIWLILVLILTYVICKSLKNSTEKFLLYFVVCLLPLFIVSRYYTLFDFVNPEYYGFDNVLYDYLPSELDFDIRKFIFWQTGVSSGFNYSIESTNFLVTFFTVPPVALFECLIKAIFPNIFIVLLLQLPIVLVKKNIIDWKKEQ